MAASDFEFEQFVCTTEEQTAQRLFATLPLGRAYAERLVPALSTGLLVATIESACITELLQHLADDETVVGTEIELSHVGPALPGHRLRLFGQGLWRADRRCVSFKVLAEDAQGRVAQAVVLLRIVGVARFAAKLARKRDAAELLAA